MAFIGKAPQAGNFIVLDSITTSATATYNLTRNSTAYFPASARNLIVSLNGITQAPDTAYSVSGSTITFSSALTSSDVIDYILVLGDVLSIGTPADNTVGIDQLNVSDGSSGQALTTDGSGTLSFSTISSSTPTLAAVTGAGATTSNAVTIGNLTSTGIDDNATSNAITIDSNENVGIGLSSPTAKLHVKGDDGLKFVIDSIYAANETLSFTSDNGTGYLLNNSTGTTSGAEGIGFNSANSKMEFKADGGTRMTIRGTGNVGIGTSSPAYRLDVYDTSNPAQIRLRNFQNTNGLIFKSYSGNEAWLVNADNGPMVFKTNNSERMRIENDGKIGIKKSNPAYPVHIVDGGNTAMYIEGDQTGYTQGAICIAGDTTDTSGYRGQGIYMFNHGADTTWYIGGVYQASDRFDICRKGSTTSFDEAAAQSTYSLATFSNSGNLSIDGSLSQNSDVSIKDNVQNLSSQLENINALRPVEYDRNDKLKAGEHEIGLIAQEVEALLPDLVGDRNGLKTLDYARLSVILLKGLQELSAKVTALESN